MDLNNERLKALVRRKPEVIRMFQDYQWHRCTDAACKKIVEAQLLDVIVGIDTLARMMKEQEKAG